MPRRAALEPAWLVGLLAQWGARSSRPAQGFPTVCAMLGDGIPGRVRSYEPTGYGGADFDALGRAIEQLPQMRRLAVLRYAKPWAARALDLEFKRDADTWLYHLKLALAELAAEMDRTNPRAPDREKLLHTCAR